MTDADRRLLVQLAMATDGSTLVQADTVIMAGDQLETSPLLPLELGRPFASTASFEQAQRVLQLQHLVVLTGSHGTGRRAAAVRLLERVAGRPIEDLSPDWDEPRVQKLPYRASARYLLDLTVDAAAVPERFARDLQHYTTKLQTENAHLVIVVGSDQWRRCEPITRSLTAPLKPPKVRDVLKAHLLRDAPDRLHMLDEEPVASLLEKLRTATVSTSELVRLARLLRDAETSKESLERVVEEYHRWEEYVLDQLGEVSSGATVDELAVAERRVLLLSAAVLDNHPAVHVLEARDKLRRRLKLNLPAGYGFGRSGLSQQLFAIRAERVGEALTISQQRPGVDTAVLDYVWKEWPQLRSTIESWLSDLSADGGSASPTLGRISEVLVGLATRQDAPELLDVAREWLTRKGPARALAITMLSKTAVDAEIGPSVRHTLYRWAKAATTEPAVLTGVAEVCAGALGQIHVGPALTRLRLIIERGHSPEVHLAATSAIRVLAADDGLRPAVIKHAAGWLADATGARVGSESFLALLDPAADNTVVPQLVADATAAVDSAAMLQAAWRLLLDDSESEERAAATLDAWLAATEGGQLDEESVIHILGPLVRSTLPKPSVLRALFGTAGSRSAGVGQSSSSDIRHRLLQDSLAHHRYGAATEPGNSQEPT